MCKVIVAITTNERNCILAQNLRSRTTVFIFNMKSEGVFGVISYYLGVWKIDVENFIKIGATISVEFDNKTSWHENLIYLMIFSYFSLA